MKFPKVLAAARQIELDQWQLGDALIEECGEPMACAARMPGRNDGSWSKLQEASEFLKSYGLDYDVTYLSKLRSTAFDFRGRDRKKNLSWSAHNEAGSPEILKTVVERIGDSKPTRDAIRETRREMEGRQEYPRERVAAPVEYSRDSFQPIAPTIGRECNALKDRCEEIEAHLGEFSQSYIDAIAEQSMDMVEYLRKFAVKVKKGGGTKRGHLNVVSAA